MAIRLGFHSSSCVPDDAQALGARDGMVTGISALFGGIVIEILVEEILGLIADTTKTEIAFARIVDAVVNCAIDARAPTWTDGA